VSTGVFAFLGSRNVRAVGRVLGTQDREPVLAGHPSNLSRRGHHCHEIPVKYAKTCEHRRLALSRARVHRNSDSVN
jgi:hypothetical protein